MLPVPRVLFYHTEVTMNDDRDYWEGQVFALRTLESLPIYLWPLDLKAWIRVHLKEWRSWGVYLNDTSNARFVAGAQLLVDLVNRLPLFGMAWRLQRIKELLSESKSGINPDEPDLWRRD